MEKIFSDKLINVGNYSAVWVKVSYEKRRNGTTQQYRFDYELYISNRTESPYQYGYYGWAIDNSIYLDDVSVWSYRHPVIYGAGWYDKQTTDWIDIPNKTSGTTKIYFKSSSVSTSGGDTINYTSSNVQLPIDNANSLLTCPTLYNTTYNTQTINYNAGLQIMLTNATNDFYVFGNQNEYDSFINGDLTSYTKRIQNLTGSFTFNFSANEINHIASLNTTKSNDIDIKLISITYEDNTRQNEIGKSIVNAKMNISGLEPTILSSVYNDTTTSSITGNTSSNPTKYVLNYTNFNVIYTVNLLCGATIESAKIGGLNAVINNNTITLNNHKSTDLGLEIVDSRGNILTYSKTVQQVNYVPLTFTGSSKRHTPVDNRISIILNGNYWQGNFGYQTNEIIIKYKIWEKYTLEPSNWTTINSSYITIDSVNNTYICEYNTPIPVDENDPNYYDYSKVYELKVSINDKMISLTPTKTISKGMPVFYWTENDFHIGTSDDKSNAKLYLNGNEISSQPTITPSQTIDSSTTDIPSNNAVKTFVEGFGTIQEVGSANDGHFIKYTNGVMICIKQVGVNKSTSSGYFGDDRGTNQSLGNQPATFTQLWGQVVSANCSNSTYFNCSITTGYSVSSMGTAQLHRPGSSGSCYGTINVISFGLWK